MVSDAFHVYPTDGKVNGQRSNYPYGECNNGTSLGTQASGRVGSSSFAGYSGVVFEPDDDYKGDFARTYFYMSTRYKGTNLAQTANGQVMFNATADLTNYSIQLLMKWHRDDPVSQKELDRNDAVYGFQHNRNPFIDHPELAEYLWGNQKGNYWYVNTTDVVIPEVDKIVVSPNPARDYIIVEGESGVFSYHIYNVTGTLMRSGEASFDEMLSVSSLTKGVYMLQIIYSGNKKMLKFVVAN